MRQPLHALLVLVLLAGVPLAAQPAGQAAAQEPIELTTWIDPVGGVATAECVILQSVDTYNALNTGITVNATIQANGWQATQTALAGGAGPDIVNTPGPSFVIPLALAGQLAELDAYAEEYGWHDRFAEGSLNLGTTNGKLYSIPSEFETLVLYYNKTLFEQNGWEPPATLDALTALAEEVAAAGIIPFANSNAEWRPANEWFVGEFLNHSAGGPQKVYDALTGNAEWTDPDFVAAIETLNQYQQNGWFSGGLDRYYTYAEAETGAMLGSGEAAMKLEGTWFLDQVNDYFGEAAGNANEWGWVPVPSVTGDVIFDLGIGGARAINANSANPDAAAEYLDYYYSPETQARILVECGLVPAPVSLEGQDLAGANPGLLEILAAMNEAFTAGNYGYTTWTFWPPESENYIIEEIERVWAGELSPEEFLQGHQELFASELEAGTAPAIPDR
jgi:raffinose/stachyose/melibiose transport system substrate-binding protein